MSTSIPLILASKSKPRRDVLFSAGICPTIRVSNVDEPAALERAAAFTDVVALGLRIEAKKLTSRGAQSAGDAEKTARAKASRLLHTAGNLFATAKDFRHGAGLWRRGRLE